MTRRRLLDLFCGGGGAGMGYHRAGFDVVGVDINPDVGKWYPFEFHAGDALAFPVEGFDAIHASPPCQRYSVAVVDKGRHENLVPAARAKLTEAGVPWVIENVPGAPIRPDYLLCGSMFGLPHLIRHRLFEASWWRTGGGQKRGPRPCRHVEGDRAIPIVGRGIPTRSGWGHVPHAEATAAARRAMGVDWEMSHEQLSEAIPPAYTEWVGARLMARLEVGRRRPPS